MTTRRARRPRRKLGFKGLESRVTREYRRKGYSPKRARAIGRATAGKVANLKRRRKRRIWL